MPQVPQESGMLFDEHPVLMATFLYLAFARTFF